MTSFSENPHLPARLRVLFAPSPSPQPWGNGVSLSWTPNPSQIPETDSDGPFFLPTALPPGWAQEKKEQNLELPHFPGPHRPISGWGPLCGQSQVGRSLIHEKRVAGGLGDAGRGGGRRGQAGHRAQVPPARGPFVLWIDGMCISSGGSPRVGGNQRTKGFGAEVDI